ncbi:TlpA disulfide reductase family protein [Bosea sp. 2KB_26]|uniref:TlpA disulfide reductase family protein n=1 Tax=Bosea sp. 2KB_26 TaxID=3237475 RepID=UPI003F8ED296
MTQDDIRQDSRPASPILHRRQVLLGSLLLGGSAGAISLLPPRALAAPPPFVTEAGGQFIELDPREDVSAISLTDFNGRTRSFASYRGRPCLVAFWASWCPPCLRELPILHRLQQRRDLGFAVVPVSIDRDAAAAQRLIDRLGLGGFASFIDRDGRVASGPKSQMQTPFQLYGMPMSYVVDARGRTAGHLAGAADWGTPEAIRFMHYFAREG